MTTLFREQPLALPSFAKRKGPNFGYSSTSYQLSQFPSPAEGTNSQTLQLKDWIGQGADSMKSGTGMWDIFNSTVRQGQNQKQNEGFLSH